MLLPPVPPGSPGVLLLEDQGDHGELLPESLYQQIDPFVRPAPGTSNAVAQSSFQVVSLRIDPCFPDLAVLESDPSLCRTQLRLVAQPVVNGFPPPPPGAPGPPSPPDELPIGATDNAIHLLYDIPAAEFAVLVEELGAFSGLEQSINVADTDASVWVPSRLQEDPAAGTARAELRELVLRYAGADRLTQFTFMRSEGSHAWDFGGFVVDNGQATALDVIGTGVPVQRLLATASVLSIEPATTHSAPLADLLAQREGTGAPLFLEGTPEAQRDAVQVALALEHPGLARPESVDCVSCHVAFPLRQRAERMGVSADGLDAYASSFPLGGAVSPDEPIFGNCLDAGSEGCLFVENRLRAFGWFAGTPVVSQRTVNEAAAVAEALNRHLLGTSP